MDRYNSLPMSVSINLEQMAVQAMGESDFAGAAAVYGRKVSVQQMLRDAAEPLGSRLAGEAAERKGFSDGDIAHSQLKLDFAQALAAAAEKSGAESEEVRGLLGLAKQSRSPADLAGVVHKARAAAG